MIKAVNVPKLVDSHFRLGRYRMTVMLRPEPMTPSLLHEIKSPLTAAKLGLNLLRLELKEKFAQEEPSEKINEITQILENIEIKVNQCVEVLQKNRAAFDDLPFSN